MEKENTFTTTKFYLIELYHVFKLTEIKENYVVTVHRKKNYVLVKNHTRKINIFLKLCFPKLHTAIKCYICEKHTFFKN